MCFHSFRVSSRHPLHRVFCLGDMFFLSRRLLAHGEQDCSSSVIPPYPTCLVHLLNEFQNSGFCSVGEVASVCTFSVLIATYFTEHFDNPWHKPLCSLRGVTRVLLLLLELLACSFLQAFCHPPLWSSLPHAMAQLIPLQLLGWLTCSLL